MNRKRWLWLGLAALPPLLYVGLQTAVIYGSAMAAAVAAGGSPLDAFGTGTAGVQAWAWYRDNLENILFLYTVLGALVFWAWWQKARPHLSPPPRQKVRARHIAGICVTGVGLQLVTNLLVVVASLVMPQEVEEYGEMVQDTGLDQPGLLMFFCAAILAPVVEEALCRGLVLGFCRRALGRFWAANLLQALCFGALHMNWVQSSYAFLLGLVLGQLWRRYRRMGYCILLHGIINACGFLPGFLLEHLPNPAMALAVMFWLGIGLTRWGTEALALFDRPGSWRWKNAG